jgi:hypothetical protein
METNGNGFELIMQEVLTQQQHMEELEAENRELRRQVADLRAGRGIFVEVLGTRFSLNEEPVVAFPDSALTQELIPAPEQQPTSTIEIPTTPIPEASLPDTEEVQEEIPEEGSLLPSSSFLEEMLLDEFSSVATSPMAIWSGSTKKSTPINEEEEKASLRRELVDSFLLE